MLLIYNSYNFFSPNLKISLCFVVKSSGVSRGTRHPSLLRLREEREPRRELPAPAEL